MRSSTTKPLIELTQISKALHGRQVLNAVDLAVPAGQIHALVGLNGAGKTTLMRIALGMLPPDAGGARLFGSAIAGLARECWSDVGQMIEMPALYPELTARQNIVTFALLRGMSTNTIEERVDDIIKELALGKWIDQRCSRLSLGTRQKVALASALVHCPRVLVLDEPANALDPSAVVRLRNLISSVADAGGAVLVSSHHLDELARLADAVTVLHKGTIVGELDPRGADLEKAFFEIVYAADRELGEDE